MSKFIRLSNSTKIRVLLDASQKEEIQSKLIGDGHPYMSIEEDYICFPIDKLGKVRDALESIGATKLLRKLGQV